MIFESPAALWSLSALLLLAIFSLWRQAASRATVPSLLLWKKIPERNPPLKALRRPAWRWELLFVALAIAAIALGLAKPAAELDRPRPRKLGIVLDTSERMRDRWGRMLARAKELSQGEDATFYAADPAPRASKDPGVFQVVEFHVDVAPLIAVARAENEGVVLISDRAPAGVDAELIRGPSGNVGLVEFSVQDGEVFARIANHGGPRKIPATLTIDGRSEPREIELPAGQRGWWEKRDLSKAREVRLELRPGDGFRVDDAASAVRAEAPETAVSVRGADHPPLRRALAAVPGVVLKDAGAALAVGVDAEPGPAPLRVRLYPPVSPRTGDVVKPEPHPLTKGLREPEIASSGVGELPPGGRALLTSGGRPLMTLDGDVLRVSIGLAPNAWPSTPSFPIFWSNVVQFARGGRAAWSVPRAGPGTSGAVLDERETDAEGASRTAAWTPGAGGAARTRAPLGGWAAAAALGFLGAAWWARRRAD
jgi:hypothetical protein